jgi:hypothetical protein
MGIMTRNVANENRFYTLLKCIKLKNVNTLNVASNKHLSIKTTFSTLSYIERSK